MTNILTARKEAAKIIHTKLKFLYYIKEVRRLIMKEEENFCIVSKIKNVKKLMMQVFVKDEKIKNFEFEYCKIRKAFVLYIQRKTAKGSVYKVQFIADKRVVIDPVYRTDYDKKGNFYNLIDFILIEKKEKNHKEEKERIMKYLLEKFYKEKELDYIFFKTSRK